MMSKAPTHMMAKEMPLAPTFTPTEEEFRAPLTFIKKISETGVRTGIVKVVPPASWQPKFNLDVKRKFESYRQAIHHLVHGEAFGSGDEFTQSEYREYARQFQDEYFKKHPEIHSKFKRHIDRGDANAGSLVLEEEYWKVVEGCKDEEIFVDYANNMDTKKYGSPFMNSRGKRSWDLTSLIHDKEGILKKVGDRIAGVTTPWLYFGCMFATFCWHVEDHLLYSLNYMHHGASKIWYGIPEGSALQFEAMLKKSLPERFKQEPDLLHQLVTMVSPGELMSEGVAVYRALQHKGEIIVTFPRAYHSGFSHGWNCAEAVNFALLNWLPIGRKAMESYKLPGSGRVPTFSHDRLLWDLCREVATWKSMKDVDGGRYHVGEPELTMLCSELKAVLKQERSKRSQFRKIGMAETVVPRPWDGEPFQCTVCKTMHFFSFCVCPCGAQSAGTTCLDHALETNCGCGMDKKVLCIQVSDKDLERTYTQLKAKFETFFGVVPSTSRPVRSKPIKDATLRKLKRIEDSAHRKSGKSLEFASGSTRKLGYSKRVGSVHVREQGQNSKRKRLGS